MEEKQIKYEFFMKGLKIFEAKKSISFTEQFK